MQNLTFNKKVYIMIHAVHLDDEYIDTKEVDRYKPERVRFENFSRDNAMLEGYISSEEFRKRAFEKVNKFCEKHGIL